jgi:hypothetical protein
LHPTPLPRFQSADPEDPWLQWEWGATLLALDRGAGARTREAGLHFEVAAAIFGRHHAHLSKAEAGDGSSGGGKEYNSVGTVSGFGSLEDLEGARMDADAMLVAASDALQSFVDLLPEALSPHGGGGGSGDGKAGRGAVDGAGKADAQRLRGGRDVGPLSGERELEEVRCDGLLRLCHILLQRAAHAKRAGTPGQAAALPAAQAGARRCVARMQGDRSCREQVKELAKLLGQA